MASQPKLKAALRGPPQVNVRGSQGVPCEVRALDQICYIGSVYPRAAVAALANVKPADQPFRLSVLLDEGDGLELRWPVAPSYFLYRDRGSATLDGKPLKVSTARGEIKDDPAFRPTEIYHREAIVHVDGKDLPELSELLVTYQGCREIPSAIRRSQSRSISPRFASPMKCWSPIKGVGRTKSATRRTRSLSDLATQRNANWTNRSSVLNDEMIKKLAAKLCVAGGPATP